MHYPFFRTTIDVIAKIDVYYRLLGSLAIWPDASPCLKTVTEFVIISSMNHYLRQSESSIAEAGCNNESVRQRLSRINDSYSRLESMLDLYEHNFSEETVNRLIESSRINKPR